VISSSELLKKRAYIKPGEISGAGVADMNNETEKNQASKIENKYMQLILKRTMNIFFVCVISAPLFMDTMYYSRHEMVEECFMTFYQTINNKNFSDNELKLLTQKFINVTLSFYETPLIYF
jgi:hypothetical protein